MVQSIKTNLEVVEAMLFFWQSTSERQKVSEKYLTDIANMEGLTITYDDEFDAESVRKVLSAVTNRELLSSKNKKESKFWNNNLWMMEDLEYTNSMVQPIKKLNLEDLVDKIDSDKYEELEVIFAPLHKQEYVIKDNKLVINFFRVRPSFTDDNTYIGEIEIKEYIEEKLKELVSR
ncbi:hypothetical protein [Dethiothermospora halolimnae]|uniref:TDE2712 family protein n=1 Tax=Dethiothermospora halolimnae TaxID=3114390 RepID=UPI003CCC2F22